MIICSVNDRESRIYENPDTDDDYEEYLSVVVLNVTDTVTVVM